VSGPGEVATGVRVVRKANRYTITDSVLPSGDPVATASGSDIEVNDLFCEMPFALSFGVLPLILITLSLTN
jgi:hypothetical protein